MVPRHESRGQKHVLNRNKKRERNSGNFLIFFWCLQGNLSQSSFFLQCSKTSTASRFTHCYLLKLNATFFFRYDEIGVKRVFEKYCCINVPRFMFPDVWLSHHFPTVLTVMWWLFYLQNMMSGYRLDLSPLKEPLGFIRVLEWVRAFQLM